MSQRLEHYLETVRSGLKTLPPAEKESEIAELRHHLSALIAAHEELGDTMETATDAALKQLGDARVIREELSKTHHRASLRRILHTPLSEFWTINGRRRFAAFRHSWLGAVACTLFAVYAAYTYVPIVSDWVYNPHNPANNPTVLYWLGYADSFLQCWLIGWLSFRLSGRRCLPILVALALWFNYYYIVPQFVRGPSSYEDWKLLIVVSSSTLVLPVLAAYISLRRSLRLRKA